MFCIFKTFSIIIAPRFSFQLYPAPRFDCKASLLKLNLKFASIIVRKFVLVIIKMLRSGKGESVLLSFNLKPSQAENVKLLRRTLKLTSADAESKLILNSIS